MQTLARPSTLRRIASAALDVVLPPRCLACGTTVGATGTLCATCWGAITFLGTPCCACCGIPFEFDLGDATLCGACARQPPPAHALAAAGGPAVGADWLIRRRRTPSQGKRNAAQRERNVRAAFTLRPGRRVKGLRVLFIDDVFTTGATVSECARVLRRAGAAGVDVLTLARTVRQEG